MGEWSKEIGEQGENIVEYFFKKLCNGAVGYFGVMVPPVSVKQCHFPSKISVKLIKKFCSYFSKLSHRFFLSKSLGGGGQYSLYKGSASPVYPFIDLEEQ